jgi:nitrous oxidase accessory protein NosD
VPDRDSPAAPQRPYDGVKRLIVRDSRLKDNQYAMHAVYAASSRFTGNVVENFGLDTDYYFATGTRRLIPFTTGQVIAALALSGSPRCYASGNEINQGALGTSAGMYGIRVERNNGNLDGVNGGVSYSDRAIVAQNQVLGVQSGIYESLAPAPGGATSNDYNQYLDNVVQGATTSYTINGTHSAVRDSFLTGGALLSGPRTIA